MLRASYRCFNFQNLFNEFEVLFFVYSEQSIGQINVKCKYASLDEGIYVTISGTSYLKKILSVLRIDSHQMIHQPRNMLTYWF